MRTVQNFFKIAFLSSAICLLFYNVGKTQSSAHWKKLHLPSYATSPTPYFLNRSYGFVFSSIGTDLYSTTDGGITWKTHNFFDSLYYAITQLYFIDLHHGFAATSSGIFETKDSGNNWQKISPDDEPYISVYASGHKIYALHGFPYASGVFGPLISSGDYGQHWDTIVAQMDINVDVFQYVFGNKDSDVFAESVDNAGFVSYLIHSTDNGVTWGSHKLDERLNYGDSVTVGLFSFPHCDNLLRVALKINDDVGPIQFSSDFGSRWKVYKPSLEVGAWIAGNNCVLYLSNADARKPQGLLRSTDQGVTWEYIDGPDFTEIDDRDFHNISVVGGGAVVYAGNLAESLWKTVDGGDGTLSASALASRVNVERTLASGSSDTLTVNACDSAEALFYWQNLSCNYARLDSFAIEGLDPAEYRTIVKHHSACDGLPDTILLYIKPAFVGTRTVTLDAHFINDEFETIDTLSSFVLKSINASGGLIISSILPNTLFEHDSLYSCEPPVTRTFRIITEHCPKPIVTKTEIIPNNGDYTLLTPCVGMLRDTTDAALSFQPKAGGPRSAKFKITLSDGSIYFIALEGYGIPSIPLQVTTSSASVDTLGGGAAIPISITGLDKPQDISLVIRYDVRNLVYNGTYSILSNKLLDVPGEVSVGRAKIFIPASEVQLSGVSANALFTVFADSNFASNVFIDSMTIPSEKVPCEYIEAPLAITTITPPSGCGVTTISNFLRYGKKPSFSIRPNPSDGNLQIQTTLRGDVNIYIYDMLGSVVAVKQFTIRENETPLDLTLLRPGTYFVRAGNSDTFLESKLLISK